jgi:parallel beta helix pectate lyase-like protein
VARLRTILAVAFAIGTTSHWPAWAEPTDITECQEITQSGSYMLANNLPGGSGLLASGNCILIKADFVTVDLAGFVIRGTSGQGTGVGTSGEHSSVVVRNGSVVNFNHGIDLEGGRANSVEGIRATSNKNIGIVVDGPIGSVGVVRNNAVANNDTGISARGLVTGNTSSGNRFGMSIERGSYVYENVVQFNVEYGIQVTCPAAVISNVVTNTFRDARNNVWAFPAARSTCQFGNLVANFTEPAN